MNQPSSDIVTQMERIRAKRSRRMLRLAEQTERLTDWREHVRAAPLAAFAVSIVGGALLTKSLLGGRGAAVRQASNQANTVWPAQPPSQAPAKPSRSLARTVFSMALPLVTAYARQQLLQTLAQGKSSPSSAGGTREQKQSN